MTDISLLTPLAAAPTPLLVVVAVPDPLNPALRHLQLLPGALLPGGGGSGGSGSGGVASFNGRTGAITLDDADVVQALSLTPYDATNPAGYQTAEEVGAAIAAAILPPIRPVMKVAASGAAQVLTAAARGDIVYDITLTANCALTLAGGTTGQEQLVRVYLRQDTTGGRTAIMPPGVKWVNNGIPPTFDTSPGGFGRVDFTTPDGGVTWAGEY